MPSPARNFRLAVVTKNALNPAYAGARLGADRVAARWGCTARHYVPAVPDDVDEQRALIEAALAERPDALLLVPAHATALNDTLRRVQAAKIALICFVARPDDVAPAVAVGSDDRTLANGIAGHLIAHLDDRGDIVTLEGHPASVTTSPRTLGFRDAAAQHAGVRIVGSRIGYYLRNEGRTAMAELLAAHAKIDGVLAANDFMALGALDAMEQSRRKIPIVGINATPEGVKAIRSGALLASAAFDAMKMACLATEAAVRLLSGERVPDEIMLPAEVVDSSNCAAWDLPYHERPLPEWSAYVPG